MIIGRHKELSILKQSLKSKEAQFLAIIGRRRVGKTFLIHHFYANQNYPYFYVTGLRNGRLQQQIDHFYQQIGHTFYNGMELKSKATWLEAFADLTKAFEQVPKKKKIILFFDEFPWMATPRSQLLMALDHYWNRYWSHNPKICLILCGSSVSWIIKKIINDKGGLHNRVTQTIHLQPFSLHESALFLKSRGINLVNRQVLDLYMALGGIPFYLAMVKKGDSAHQSIGKLLLQKNGELVAEYTRLFDSLFKNASHYINLVETLAKHRQGLSQVDLWKHSKESQGGRSVDRLKELEQVGFISSFIPNGRQEKGIYYKVVDEYILFYLTWVKPILSSINKMQRGDTYWVAQIQTAKWQSWAGVAFEAICYKHLNNIAQALEIHPAAIATSWKHIANSADDQGAQIDLLFEQPGLTTALVEIKYNDKPFIIDKQYAATLKNKISVYQKQTKTTNQLFLYMITVAGLKENMYAEDLITKVAKLDDLFL